MTRSSPPRTCFTTPAPRQLRQALFAYNPSRLYVDAVQRYARLIKRDAYALYFLYCWGP